MSWCFEHQVYYVITHFMDINMSLRHCRLVFSCQWHKRWAVSKDSLGEGKPALWVAVSMDTIELPGTHDSLSLVQ